MNYKIVADSSSNILSLDQANFTSVPLHILVGEHEFVDDEQIDLVSMQNALSSHKGKSSTSCPSPGDWEAAFEDAETVFCVTITSELSGSNASANTAKQLYEEQHPDRKVYIFDSLSAGPEIVLIIEKIHELILSGCDEEQVYLKTCEYMQHTHLYFSLASIANMAKNGRVSPILAKGIGLLGIKVVGKASDAGTLQPLDKCRGDKRAIRCLVDHMKELGYQDGKIIIAHNQNLEGAKALKELIIKEFGDFHGYIHETRGLCSYYAEPQSMMLGFEA